MLCALMRISYLVVRISLFALMGFSICLRADELKLSSQQQKIFEEAKGFAETLHSSKTASHSLRDTLHESRDTNLFSQDTKANSHILIFVSFSVGETALMQYAQEAKKAGASLMFRGLIGDSLKTAALRLQTLVQKTQANFLIDPTLFRDFGIEKVPAVVVTVPNNASRDTLHERRSFDVVYGLTTLDYALEKIAREGETGSVAQTALQKLRSRV